MIKLDSVTVDETEDRRRVNIPGHRSSLYVAVNSDPRNCGLSFVTSLSVASYSVKLSTEDWAALLATALFSEYGSKMMLYNSNHKQADVNSILMAVGFEPIYQWQNFVHPEVDIITLWAISDAGIRRFLERYAQKYQQEVPK